MNKTSNQYQNGVFQIVRNKGIIGNISKDAVKLTTGKFNGYIDFGQTTVQANTYYQLSVKFNQSPVGIVGAVTDQAGQNLSIKHYVEGDLSVSILYLQNNQTVRIRVLSSKKQDISINQINFAVSSAQLIDYHQANESPSQGKLLSLDSVYRQQLSSVVQIVGLVGGLIGSGTGFFISKDGFIGTAAHVVDELSDIHVEFHPPNNHQKVSYKKAEVVGIDRRADLAVIKLVESEVTNPISWAESDHLKIGAAAILIGQPQGSFDFSFSRGIIRDIAVYESTTPESLKLDTPLTTGNSGGPVFNQQGKCIGIVSYAASHQNFGGAIPSSLAKPILTQIKATSANYIGGFLGVSVKPITGVDMMINRTKPNFVQLKHVHGFQVISSTTDSGLQSGDLITQINGKTVGIHRFHQSLFRPVHSAKHDSTVDISIIRYGKFMSLEQTIKQRPSEHDTIFTTWL